MAMCGDKAGSPKRISILGATGSIGTNTLDVIGRNQDRFEVEAVTANSNVAELAAIARKFNAKAAVIGVESKYAELKECLSDTDIEVAAGTSGLMDAALRPADCVMAAIIGAAGLKPTFAALSQGARVALANKECLVSAGDVFMNEVARTGSELIPVDSEHSAAFQAIELSNLHAIERVILTASGGPFRTWTKDEILKAKPEDALKHPNWSMGAKITIDSATLMNKGLEVIEAYHLFPLEKEQLDIVVHPQSIIHCMVEYYDGSVMAQLSAPDMRTPIVYSLSWPRRMSAPTERLDLVRQGTLEFEAPDEVRFPAIRLAREAMHAGGGACTVLNAANEVAVGAFLERKISFGRISALVEQTLEEAERLGLSKAYESLDEVVEIDLAGRELAQRLL